MADLIFDLEKTDYWITGDHEVFEDTAFKGLDFKIRVEPLMRKEYNMVRSKYSKFKGGVEVTDNDKLDAESFLRQVKDWSGIKDPKGKDIPCTGETKKIFLEKKFFFCRLINTACLFFQNEIEEQKEKLEKN